MFVLRQRLKRKARTMRFGMDGLAVESVCAAQLCINTFCIVKKKEPRLSTELNLFKAYFLLLFLIIELKQFF